MIDRPSLLETPNLANKSTFIESPIPGESVDDCYAYNSIIRGDYDGTDLAEWEAGKLVQETLPAAQWDAMIHDFTALSYQLSQVCNSLWEEMYCIIHGAQVGMSQEAITQLLSGAQTFTNKTISFDSNTLTNVASLNTAQTLTNKTINFADNTLQNVASLDTTQTLTNKTISYADNTLTGVQQTLTASTGITISGTTISTKKTDLIDMIYPVGSIYMSVNSTSPATLFGGSWTQLTNTFLLACGSSYTAGSTGGAATVALETANLPSHNHTATSTSTTTTTGTINNHTHTGTTDSKTPTGYTFTGTKFNSQFNSFCGSGTGSNKDLTNSKLWYDQLTDKTRIDIDQGSDASWFTIGLTYTPQGSVSGGAHTHTFTTSGVSGTVSATSSTSTTTTIGSTGSGTAHNNMPPYLAVYMWKRTA